VTDLIELAFASAALGYFLAEHEAPFGFMLVIRQRLYGVRDDQGECRAAVINPLGQALCCAECTSFWCALVLSVGVFHSFAPLSILAAWGGALVILRWIN